MVVVQLILDEVPVTGQLCRSRCAHVLVPDRSGQPGEVPSERLMNQVDDGETASGRAVWDSGLDGGHCHMLHQSRGA